MKDEYNRNSMTTVAVIYCRVSSTKQRIEGSGLESQEQRCRAYAIEKGYTVEAVFPDDVSGGGESAAAVVGQRVEGLFMVEPVGRRQAVGPS